MSKKIAANFDATKEDAELIRRIVDRFIFLAKMVDSETRLELEMDITAAHRNGCPLDLERMLGFDDFSLAHDVSGIHRYIDRNTGRLTNCFCPRSARSSVGGKA
jgi:hypothetical protein